MSMPSWLKLLASGVAVLVAALLIAGEVGVAYRFMQSPEGYEQPRYTLGALEIEGATQINAGSPAATAVAFAKYEDPAVPLFGWSMNADSLAGYRAFTVAPTDQPAIALLISGYSSLD